MQSEPNSISITADCLRDWPAELGRGRAYDGQHFSSLGWLLYRAGVPLTAIETTLFSGGFEVVRLPGWGYYPSVPALCARLIGGVSRDYLELLVEEYYLERDQAPTPAERSAHLRAWFMTRNLGEDAGAQLVRRRSGI